MLKITEAAREAIITKALNRGEETLVKIAAGNNIAISTLNRWLRKGKSSVNANKQTGLIGLGDRYRHLKATFGQEDVIVGAYCRKHGLYAHQLAEWEAEFMTNSTNIGNKQSQPNTEIRALQKEIKELKHIIMRKDKVLAETMALLILKKKAAQIWEASEDD